MVVCDDEGLRPVRFVVDALVWWCVVSAGSASVQPLHCALQHHVWISAPDGKEPFLLFGGVRGGDAVSGLNCVPAGRGLAGQAGQRRRGEREAPPALNRQRRSV